MAEGSPMHRGNVERPDGNPFSKLYKELDLKLARDQIKEKEFDKEKALLDRLSGSADPKKELNLLYAREKISDDLFDSLKDRVPAKESPAPPPPEPPAEVVEPARVRVAPEPIVNAEETAAIFNIEGLDGKEPKIEAAVAEVTTEVNAATKSWTEKSWTERMLGQGDKIAGHMPEIKISRKDVLDLLGQLKTKRFWGTTAFELVSGGAAGYLARNIANSIGVLTGGAGYLISVPAGMAAGALSGGLTTYLRERHREISRDEMVEKARTAEGGLKEKLDSYLNIVAAEEQRELMEIGGKKDRLYQELRGSFGVRGREIRRGIYKGALFGAVGGFVGTWLTNHFFSGTGGGGKAAENLAEAKKAAQAAGGEAMRQQIEQAGIDASGKAYENAIKTGVASLDAKSFNVFVKRGEGATHLARNLIHDYIVEQRALLGNKFALLDKAQLVYAEDYLRRFAFEGQAIEPSKMVKVVGQNIAGVIAEARGLTAAEIANLNKNWVGKIGKGAWKAMLDYGEPHFKGNNFSQEILERAKSVSAAAGKIAGEDMGRTLAAPQPSPAATEAAESFFTASRLKWGLGAVGTGLALGTALRFRETIASGAVGTGRAIARGARKVGSAVTEYRRGLGEGRREARQKRQEAREAKRQKPEADETSARRMADALDVLRRLQERADEKREEPGPVVDVEQRRRDDEAAQRAETDRLEAQRTAKEREEHEKKLAADPVHNLFKKFGQTIEPRDGLQYRAPSKEALEAGGGNVLDFDNYPDFCKFLRSLTPKQIADAEGWTMTFFEGTKYERKVPALGILANQGLWDKLEANPELKKGFYEMYPKIRNGLLADEYRGLPEKEDPAYAIEPLMDELKAKFKGESFSFYRRSDSEIPLEEEVEGLRKLSRALGSLKREELAGTYYHFMMGRGGLRTGPLGRQILEIDPSFSEQEMREYVLSMQPKITETSRFLQEGYDLRRDIKAERGFYVTGADYEDGLDAEQEISSLQTLNEALQYFPTEALEIPGKTTILKVVMHDREVREDSGNVLIYIPSGLSAENTRLYLMSVAERVESMKQAEPK